MIERMSLRAKINTTIGAYMLIVGLAVSWLSYRSAMVEMETRITSQVNAVSVTFSRYVG